jgi:hypothetical protein
MIGTVVVTVAVKGKVVTPTGIYFCAPGAEGIRAVEAWWFESVAGVKGTDEATARRTHGTFQT